MDLVGVVYITLHELLMIISDPAAKLQEGMMLELHRLLWFHVAHGQRAQKQS